jgi:uracil-DNA glycosylase family 4
MEDIQADKAKALDEIAASILADNVAAHLAATATQLVFGTGNPNSDLVFIGEAPGKNEDLKGEPFVGAAGKFLNEMLASIGLVRQDIYITNIVKYRPPDNRDPTPDEIQEFIPYLKSQISVIKPKLVIFLGRHSMSVFLPELKISQAHGKPVRKGGQVYLPLFHPAAALYNGGMRDTLMADFALIPSILKKIG